jgi:hypothetical protein
VLKEEKVLKEKEEIPLKSYNKLFNHIDLKLSSYQLYL